MRTRLFEVTVIAIDPSAKCWIDDVRHPENDITDVAELESQRLILDRDQVIIEAADQAQAMARARSKRSRCKHLRRCDRAAIAVRELADAEVDAWLLERLITMADYDPSRSCFTAPCQRLGLDLHRLSAVLDQASGAAPADEELGF